MTTEAKTPLIELLRELTDAQRNELSNLSKTSVSYLYALGSCSRRSCRTPKAVDIEAATRVLNKKYGSRIVTVQELATMCACV